jgi:putative chitinase
MMRTIREFVPTVTASNDALYTPILRELMPKYGIDTPLRQRHFLAQLLHESAGFNAVRENLNYSGEALWRTFPRHFATQAEAMTFARQPERIANRVYANRMSNGNEASGDGWRFIGRGLIQITGRANYTAVSCALFGDDRLLTNPELLEQPRNAVESACWFWKSNNLNQFADRDDINTVTRRINGGVNGLADRQKYYNQLNGWV